MNIETGILFTWCPHWGKASGYHLHVEKDKAFMKKGVKIGLEKSYPGVKVHPNPTDKMRLLDLCRSEGMQPEALVCLNLLLEQKWFPNPEPSKRHRTE